MINENSTKIDLKSIPHDMHEHLTVQWSNFLQALTPDQYFLLQQNEFISSVAHVWAYSKFVLETCLYHPEIIADLFASNDILHAYDNTHYQQPSALLSPEISTLAEFNSQLRKQRRREIVRIIWRDLAGYSDLNESLHELSALADQLINCALEYLYKTHSEQFGIPHDCMGNPQQLFIIAVGKLGGYELNLSSDVDLIFAYPEAGEIYHASNPISHEFFFTRLAQQLVKTLDEITVDGFVYRVDLRLRPFGESGPLVMSFNALETYYQQQGRDWERYALVKARLISGDLTQRQRLMNLLNAFVYRRYVDFSVIDSLRQLKQLIDREVKTNRLELNIKRGPGGIREVEFIAQVVQLIRGGQNIHLQEPNLQKILTLLKEENYLPGQVIDELISAYHFLRQVEHRLQAYADQQTHQLPTQPLEQARIALSMQFKNWDEFNLRIKKHRASVQNHFAKMIMSTPEQEIPTATPTTLADFANVWSLQANDEETLALLKANGYPEPLKVLTILKNFQGSSRNRLLSGRGRTRLNQLIPLILAITRDDPDPIHTLSRVINFIEAIMRRSSYLALLLENTKALLQLIKLCSASSWIAEQLSKHPVILDELLDQRVLFAPLDSPKLKNELAHTLAILPDPSFEQQMDALRNFKHAQLLHVAASQIVMDITPIQVSRHLTDIADVLVEHVKTMAWQQITERYHIDDKHTHHPQPEDFAIIAYGKLGTSELSYQSDLDLVFLYDIPSSTPEDSQIEFFVRVAQRIIHILNTSTTAGILYEIDARLRPSGAAGLLVTSLSAFAEYQLNKAWTYEHQALVKARLISKNQSLQERFKKIRQQALAQQRDTTNLQQEIVNMREQMRSAERKIAAEFFHLKHGLGGLTDIEFIVQYLVLLHSHENIKILTFNNTVKLLDYIADHHFPNSSELNTLRNCYQAYLKIRHELALQNKPMLIAATELCEERNEVVRIWKLLFG